MVCDGDNVSSEDSALTINNGNEKLQQECNLWGGGHFGHLKRNCQKDGASSTKTFKSNDFANTVLCA